MKTSKTYKQNVIDCTILQNLNYILSLIALCCWEEEKTPTLKLKVTNEVFSILLLSGLVGEPVFYAFKNIWWVKMFNVHTCVVFINLERITFLIQ